MQNRLRVLVVDDEPIARNGLVKLLQEDPELDVLEPAADGEVAVAAITTHEPDLVLLDVQMPELDGFGVIRSIGTADMPAVIFVTAFDEYAIRAFDVAAVDYLLKPVDELRLRQAVRRGKASVRVRNAGDALTRLMRTTERGDAEGYANRLAIKESGRIVFVPVRDIDWIEGADYYARLHIGPRSLLLRETLTALECRLDPQRFFRTHRSAIVQLDRVRELKWPLHGEGMVILQNGARVRLARGRRDVLTRAMQHVDMAAENKHR